MFTSFGYIALAFISVLVTLGYIINSGSKKRWWSIPTCLVVLIILFFAYRKADLEERRQIDSFKSKSYEDGYEAGEDYGLEKGKDYGYDEGYYDGYNDGESEGYDDGYEAGFIDGRADGYGEGYQDGCTDTTYDILNP